MKETLSQHTPGPWTITDGKQGYIRPDCYRGVGGFGSWPSICQSGPWPERWGVLQEDEAVANARLIAAAPDLYEVCVEIGRENIAMPEWLAKKLVNAVSKALCGKGA